MNAIIWTRDDMIEATVEAWGCDDIEAADCEVIRDDSHEPPCLIVHHEPTGRTSDEAGDGGRWHLDGRAFA
jgi:hypothetical protein